MRAGPLSSSRVIGLLNRYFVPVYISNEDYYTPAGMASPDERAELMRLYNAAIKAGFSNGTVFVYIIAPDGRLLATMNVSSAVYEDRLVGLLERAIQELRVSPGEPVVPPTPQFAGPSSVEPGSLVLHVTARYTRRGGSWNEFPAEDWVVLSPTDSRRLLPGEPPVRGLTWSVDNDAVTPIFVHCYPQTEDNDLSRIRIDHQVLKATVVAVQDGMARVRLDGILKMKHAFYPGRDDTNFVDATLVGFVDFEVATRTIRTFRLVTDKAVYGREAFAVAIRSVP